VTKRRVRRSRIIVDGKKEAFTNHSFSSPEDRCLSSLISSVQRCFVRVIRAKCARGEISPGLFRLHRVASFRQRLWPRAGRALQMVHLSELDDGHRRRDSWNATSPKPSHPGRSLQLHRPPTSRVTAFNANALQNQVRHVSKCEAQDQPSGLPDDSRRRRVIQARELARPAALGIPVAG